MIRKARKMARKMFVYVAGSPDPGFPHLVRLQVKQTLYIAFALNLGPHNVR